MFSSYPVCYKVRSALAEFFRSLDKGRMRCYNILGDINVIISHVLQLDPITEGSVLLYYNLVTLKRGSHDTILTVKRIEWRNTFNILV